ncbi:hypothetical protein DD237_007403 [Peronospora effusa]|uniref:Uncharacterized protein n=1 Tax=Peronospora effusa TaxID=542832 RepID=A0A425CF88_9STRA|nr:hypothetical protein DD237_007403 [Peronospora effusa]
MVNGYEVKKFQWFGQTRWHDKSSLLVRLKGMKKGDENLKTMHMRKRMNRCYPSPSGPYIYCNRLGYLGDRVASRPLEFRWQLLDLDLLQ